MRYQMEVELMDLNNPMDNFDANYPLLKVIEDAIEESNKNSKFKKLNKNFKT